MTEPRAAPPRGGRRRFGGESGFTLLEIIVVMVIISVAVGLIGPRIGAGLKQSAVRRSVQQFVSAVRATSARSIAERRRLSLTVWPDDAEFEVDGHAPFELPSFASFGDVDGGRLGDDDEVLFDFYPSGSSSGGTVVIEFEIARRVQAYELRINPLISRVEIEEAD